MEEDTCYSQGNPGCWAQGAPGYLSPDTDVMQPQLFWVGPKVTSLAQIPGLQGQPRAGLCSEVRDKGAKERQGC